MEKISIKKNLVYNIINQITNLVVPLLLTPYLSRVLGVNGIGKYSYVYSIVTYFILVATLGTDLYGQREVSYNQDNKDKYSKVFFEIILLRLFLVSLTILIYLFFTIYLFDVNLKKLFLFLILIIINVAIDITWFFSGLENFKLVCIRNFVIKVLNAILIFVFVKKESDLGIYVLIMSICTVFSSISLWYNIKDFISLKNISGLNPFRHLKDSIILFIPTIAITLYTVFDKTMLGLFSNDYIQNGYYEQAHKIVNIVLKLVTVITYVFMPRIAYLKSLNDDKKIKDYFYNVAIYVWFIALPSTMGIIAIANNIVPWFFGLGYEGCIPMLKLLSVLIIIIGFSNLIGIQYLLPNKKDKYYITSVVLGAIVNIILNIILIPKFLGIGAVVSSIMAEICVTGCQCVNIRRDIDLIRVLKSSFHYLFASLIMFFIIYVCSLYMKPSIINSTILIMLGISVYSIILYILKDNLYISLISYIDIVLSKKGLITVTLFYLTCKALPYIREASVLTYIMIFYSMCYFIYNIFIKKEYFRFNYFWISYSIFIISVISVLINGTPDVKKTIIDLIPVFVNWFVFFPISKEISNEKLRNDFDFCMKVLFYICLLISIGNILHYIYIWLPCNYVEGVSRNIRMVGLLGNPNLVGWFTLTFIGIILYNYICNTLLYNKIKKYYFIVIVIAIVCLIFSQCRSAILSLIIYCFLYFITINRYNHIFKRHIILFSFLSIFVIIGMTLLLAFVFDRGESGRFSIYKYSIWNFLNHNMFFGMGYGRIREFFVDNYYVFFNNVNTIKKIPEYFYEANTHNVFLQQLCTNGIIGLIIYIIFFVDLLRHILAFINNIRFYDKNTKDFILTLIYFIITNIVVSLFDNNILNGMTLFSNFMFIFATSSFIKIIKK